METKILPLVTTHNPRNPNITPVISKFNGIVKRMKIWLVIDFYAFFNSKMQPKIPKWIPCPSPIKYIFIYIHILYIVLRIDSLFRLVIK